MATATSGLASDRTLNKVAFCSAIVAGAAYVSYKYFTNKKANKQDCSSLTERRNGRNNRIYLRRLSGSEVSGAAAAAAAAAVGSNSDPRPTDTAARNSDRNTLFFRPFSVQERIRELNVRARHFAETVMAVHLHEAAAASAVTSPGTPMADGRAAMITHSQSLQPSPTHGTKLFAPIEITALGSSRCSSTENLNRSLSSASLHEPSSFELKRTASRRSLRGAAGRRSECGEDLDEDVGGPARMLEERQAELQKRLKEFEAGPAIVLTPYEARSLVALLHTDDCDTLERAIVAVANSCAFSANQDTLREAGCLHRLQNLVVHPDPGVKLSSLRAVSNLALNVDNQKVMGRTVSNVLSLLDGADMSSDGQASTVQVLQTLTNVAALNDWHYLFSDYVPRIWNLLVCSSHTPTKVQSLRLLTNLSTNDDMTGHVLTPQIPFGFWNLIDIKTAEEILLRAISLVANLMASDQKKSIMISPVQQQDDLNHTNGQIVDLKKYGLLPEAMSPVLTRLAKLMLSHPHEDVRMKARNVLNLIKGH